MTDSYDIFPKPQATKLTVFSAYSQYQRAAMAGYFVLTGCTVSRTSASEVAIASGTFANGGVSKTYAGGSVSSITAASSGKQKIGLIYIDGADDTAKIEYGAEQTPSNTDYFLENSLPLPPNLGDEDWAVLALVRITEDGITDTSFGDPVYATGSVANIRYSGTMVVDNSTITISNGIISVANHASKHITGGSDEVDGDKLDIDWNPSNYTPSTSPSEADNADNLTAHLYGIDQKLGTSTLQSTVFGTVLAENTAIILDPSLSADGKYSGIVETGVAGTTLAFGDVIYQAVADDRWELAKADAAATSAHRLGICVQAAAGDGSATTILLIGKVRADTAFPTFTKYAPVYISSATAGDLSTTAPSKSTGHIVRCVGHAITADELWFQPDGTWLEYA